MHEEIGKSYNETILLLMADTSLFDFVIPHAQNHLESLEWTAITDLYEHKRDAVEGIPNKDYSTDSYVRMAAIFGSYRKGVLDMELFFHQKSTSFLNKLKNSLYKAKKEIKGKSTFQKKKICQRYTEQFLHEMDEFDEMYKNEYKRIIPIVFPGSDDEF